MLTSRRGPCPAQGVGWWAGLHGQPAVSQLGTPHGLCLLTPGTHFPEHSGPLCLCGSRGNGSTSGARTGGAGGGRKWLAAQVRPCSAGRSGLDPTGVTTHWDRGQDGRRAAHVLSPHETRQGVWHSAQAQTLGLKQRRPTHSRQAALWTSQNCRCQGPQDSVPPRHGGPTCWGPSDIKSPWQAPTWAHLQVGRPGQPCLPAIAWPFPLVTHKGSGTESQNRWMQAGGAPSSCRLSLSDVILSQESLRFKLIIQRTWSGISLPANRTRAAPGGGRGWSPSNYLCSVNKQHRRRPGHPPCPPAAAPALGRGEPTLGLHPHGLSPRRPPPLLPSCTHRAARVQLADPPHLQGACRVLPYFRKPHSPDPGPPLALLLGSCRCQGALAPPRGQRAAL